MKRLAITIVTVLAACSAMTATAASAQIWGYDSYLANQAYRSADVRSLQARRDQHAADVAASFGDYGAADAYAHAANMRRIQARQDYRAAVHQDNVARRDYWFGW